MRPQPDSDRNRVAVGRAVEALYELARDIHLTNDELIAVLGFLKEVTEADELVLLSDVLGLSRIVDDQTHAASEATPNNVLGPFYRTGAPWVDNPGSIAPADLAVDAERIELWGSVRDTDGLPIANAVIDVWQADERGLYSNEDARGSAWSLRGRQRVASDGLYRLETVRPKHYTVKHDGPVGRMLAAVGRHPWRPAHIHFLASAPGHRDLVTQAYVAGGPYLEDDAIGGVKDELIVPIEDGRMRFDITLARA